MNLSREIKRALSSFKRAKQENKELKEELRVLDKEIISSDAIIKYQDSLIQNAEVKAKAKANHIHGLSKSAKDSGIEVFFACPDLCN